MWKSITNEQSCAILYHQSTNLKKNHLFQKIKITLCDSSVAYEERRLANIFKENLDTNKTINNLLEYY